MIVRRQRNDVNSLWNVPLAPKETQASQKQHSANGAIKNVRTKQDLTAFLHACAFSLLPSTFLRAVQCGWSLQILARPDHDPHHQTPSQITSNQQRPSTHGAAKHSVDQNHHQPQSSNITRYHLLPETKQSTNECHFCHHTNRSQTTKIILRPDRQVLRTILVRLQLRDDASSMTMTATSYFPNPSRLAKPAS